MLLTTAQELVNRTTVTLTLAPCRTAASAMAIADSWEAAGAMADKALADYWQAHAAAAGIVLAGELRYIANVEI